MLKFNIRHLSNKFSQLKKLNSCSFWPSTFIHHQQQTFQTQEQMNALYKPKLYGDINSKMPSEYWDYENYENSWGLLLTFQTFLLTKIL